MVKANKQDLQDHAVDSSPIEIWLHRTTRARGWHVLNARLRLSTHDQTVEPDLPMAPSAVFVPEIADLLETRLGEARDTSVYSHAEYVIDLPLLQLRGLYILTHLSKDGGVAACVRFSNVDGNLGAVFAPALRPLESPQGDLDALILPLLQDLLCPALEVFDHVLENGLSEPNAKVLAARVKTMRAKRDELSDYVTLLTRFAEIDLGTTPRTSSPQSGASSVMHLTTSHALDCHSVSWNASTGPVRGHSAAALHGHHVAANEP
jgi:hypothetical protein